MMFVFSINNINELKEYLYNSDFHDATVLDVHYNLFEKSMKIIIETSNKNYNLSFMQIQLLLYVQKEELSNYDSIYSISVEDYPNDLNGLRKDLVYDIDNCICLLFQMFSGVEVYVLSNTFTIEIG